MVGVNRVAWPDAAAHERYKLYVTPYEETYECLKDTSHGLVELLR